MSFITLLSAKRNASVRFVGYEVCCKSFCLGIYLSKNRYLGGGAADWREILHDGMSCTTDVASPRLMAISLGGLQMRSQERESGSFLGLLKAI